MNLVSRFLAAALLMALAVAPAAAQERTAVKGGFELAPQSGKTILVFRPTVRVGAQSTGGIFEPNADWTDQARKNIDEALAKRQAKLGNKVISAPMSYGDEARLVEEYSALFAAVSQSVIQYQFFVGNRLPTKKRSEEHTSELQSLMRISYAVFCLKKKTKQQQHSNTTNRKH